MPSPAATRFASSVVKMKRPCCQLGCQRDAGSDVTSALRFGDFMTESLLQN